MQTPTMDGETSDSDDEDLGDPLKCLCHFTDKKLSKHEEDSVVPVTRKSWNRLTLTAKLWKDLAKYESELYGTIASNFPTEPTDTSGYHSNCYKRFTNQKYIDRAKKRKAKGVLKNAPVVKKKKETPPPKKKPEKPLSRKAVVLDRKIIKTIPIHPSMCIICKGRKTVKSFDKGRYFEKVTICTSESSRVRLRKSAEICKDGDILNFVPLKTEDLNDLVKYHNTCFKYYVRFTYGERRKKLEEIPLAQTFEQFCEKVIIQQILQNSETLRMNALRYKFAEMAKEIENIDAHDYSNTSLKKKLLRRFSNRLKFTKTHGNVCEMVSAVDFTNDEQNEPGDAGVETSADIVSHSDAEEDHDDNIEDDENEDDYNNTDHRYTLEDLFNPIIEAEKERANAEEVNEIKTVENKEQTNESNSDLNDMFRSSQIIKALLQSVNLNGHSMNENMLESMVPDTLLKFLWWCIGPDESNNINASIDDIPYEMRQKLLDICKNMVLTHNNAAVY